MYMELGSECSVSDPETDTRCAGPGDRIVPIASATRASHLAGNRIYLSIMGPEEPGKCNWHGRRCSIGEAGEGGGTC